MRRAGAPVYGKSLVSGVVANPGKQASRLHAGETPALPAPVTKICRTSGAPGWRIPDASLC